MYVTSRRLVGVPGNNSSETQSLQVGGRVTTGTSGLSIIGVGAGVDVGDDVGAGVDVGDDVGAGVDVGDDVGAGVDVGDGVALQVCVFEHCDPRFCGTCAFLPAAGISAEQMFVKLLIV